MRLFGPPGTAADPSWRNVLLLVQLRWIAVAGQLATIFGVIQFLGAELPLVQLLAAPLLLICVNIAAFWVLPRRTSFRQGEIVTALFIDVGALFWLLYFSGGATNPFTFLFLLQIVIGTVILERRQSWAIAITACLAIIALNFTYVPLDLPRVYEAEEFRLYQLGSLFCFILAAVLLVFFVNRMDRNRRESDSALEAMRRQAAEEDHIIRMGLLASGAAHELGTPLSSMSVILGDWARLPALSRNAQLSEDIADMRTELDRCKTIVSGILMSAGEMRGENPRRITVRRLMGEIAQDWQSRCGDALVYDDRFGEDASIISDPGLRQVIGNVIDNAREASSQHIGLVISRADNDLVIEVTDHGAGFAPETMERIGQPYTSTKGRDGGGLGLFLTVNVMRKLGGRVEVANLPRGGALVRLSIPLAALGHDTNEGGAR